MAKIPTNLLVSGVFITFRDNLTNTSKNHRKITQKFNELGCILIPKRLNEIIQYNAGVCDFYKPDVMQVMQ